MTNWAEVAGIVPPGLSIDRDAGEGPPRCCGRRLVAADALLCYDDLAPPRRKALLERLPHLADASPLYLCDGCSELLIREQVITREERALDFKLSPETIEKARKLDAEAPPFRRSGRA